MGYDTRLVDPSDERPAFSYEPFVSPSPAPECPNIPAKGTIFHYGLKPRTRVPSGCSLWTNHAVLDRRYPFTIPLNKIEYLAVRYLREIVLPWNRRSQIEYSRNVPLSLTPSASSDYATWSATNGGYLLDMIMADYKRELQLLNDSLSMIALLAST